MSEQWHKEKPCKRGHTLYNKYGCIECHRQAQRAFTQKPKQKALNKQRQQEIKKESQDYRIYQREYVRRYQITITNAKQVPRWRDHEAIMSIFREADRLQAQDGIEYTIATKCPIGSVLVSGLWTHHNLEIVQTKLHEEYKAKKRNEYGRLKRKKKVDNRT